MAALSCVVLSAACGGDTPQADVSGDTEVNLVISDPATASEELLLLIDFVSYRITCPNSLLTPSYDDSVDGKGVFEVDAEQDPPIWEVVADLPLSECTIALWVFYEDEVICSGSQLLQIYEDGNPLTPNKADVVLECSLSVIPPSGDADIDGTFDFVHGNYCPQVFWLGWYPSPDPLVLNIQTHSLDVDGTCGQNCDPQTCDFTTNPPTCSHAQDPGAVTSTLSAPAGNGTFGDPLALDTTYACDPLLPGPTEICVLVTDGDNDCDRMRCMTIVCPDLCEGVVCDDTGPDADCTRDRCDPLTGLCSHYNAPLGIACNDCGGTCDGAGVCTGVAWTAANEFNSTDTGPFTMSGTQQSYSATLVNPYSGATVPVSGTYTVNNSSYKGLGTDDVLEGIRMGGDPSEVLLIRDPGGAQTICGVETLRSLNGFDVMSLADDNMILSGMMIEGGTNGDLLWANAGDDTVLGDMGDDIIDGGYGDDDVDGGLGNDTITLWPGSGFDSITGGSGVDTVDIDAIQSQILIEASGMGSGYEFDIFYLGAPMAEIREAEFLVMNDASIDLTTCTGPLDDVCNLCGDDSLNGGEGCDDGNNVDGDGCTADCVAEY